MICSDSTEVLKEAKEHAVLMRSLKRGSSKKHREAVESEARTSEGRAELIQNYKNYLEISHKRIEILNNAERNENGLPDNKGQGRV
jgi:hypothetical protein